MSSTSSDNMVNFGKLAAEIGPVVWGTPANFNGFRVFAALLHGTSVVGVSQTLRAALNRRRHLHSAGRPSRWALVHILVNYDNEHNRVLSNAGLALTETGILNMYKIYRLFLFPVSSTT